MPAGLTTLADTSPALQRESHLCYDWRAIAYTDGSAVAPPGPGAQSLGSAFYVPGSLASPLVAGSSAAVGGHTSAFVSTAPGPANTINRAELVAIHEALAYSPPPSVIATDSATSLAWIEAHLDRPLSTAALEHKHACLLRAIAARVQARATPITFIKVASHVGIVGNEMADVGATGAAKGDEVTAGTVDDYAASRDSLHWLYTGSAVRGAVQYAAVDDLGGALKKHCRAVHTLGTANTASYYYTCWDGLRKSADGPISNAFMSPGLVTRLQRQRTLRYRTGTLICGAVAFKLGRAPTPHCALGCMDSSAAPPAPARDTCHHSVSGCSHTAIRGMVTDRHNAAGLAILKAIRQGARGACVAAADVGVLPPSLAGVPRALPGNSALQSRPDIVLKLPGTRASPLVEYVCVEVKYCCDYLPADQMRRAGSQHRALHDSLRAAGCKVTPVEILLGVAGTVTSRFLADARTHLGLTPTQARALGKSLHLLAVRSLSNIYSAKRSFERQAAKAAAPPSPGAPAAGARPRLAPAKRPPAGLRAPPPKRHVHRRRTSSSPSLVGKRRRPALQPPLLSPPDPGRPRKRLRTRPP